MRDNHRIVIDRFVAACQADERVVAAFLGGSLVTGAADEYSDLDLGLVTTDEAYADFYAGRAAFLSQLGELVFLEDFGFPYLAFYVFADGTEGELGFGREGEFTQIHLGPYQVLLDKNNILAGAIFLGSEVDPVEQTEKLRRLLHGFWHEVSHLITALGRNQLWWAQGQLAELRHACVKLARFQNDFFDAGAGDEGYFKIETVMPVEQLAPLCETFCPMDKAALLQSAFVVVWFYQALAVPLAQLHGLPYPQKLEQVMVERLEKLRRAASL